MTKLIFIVKSIDANISEIKAFIGMFTLMGVINFPSYTRYWPTTLCYEPIASVMPMKQNELQQKYLHTVDNTFYNQYKKNKPFKIR